MTKESKVFWVDSYYNIALWLDDVYLNFSCYLLGIYYYKWSEIVKNKE